MDPDVSRATYEYINQQMYFEKVYVQKNLFNSISNESLDL